MEIDNIQAERISFICKRLQNSITSIQVVNWLLNFKEEEWNLALDVLQNLVYYSISDIIRSLDEGLNEILTQIPDDEKIFIHGIGEYGKSGSSLVYYIIKTPTYNSNKHRFKILVHLKKIHSQGIKQDSNLILIDDVIGSGQSLIKFFKHDIEQQLNKKKFTIKTFLLCMAYMESSLPRIRKEIDIVDLYGTCYKKAFSSNGSVFGYRNKMIPIRGFCYGYGINLFETYDYEKKQTLYHALGYNNSQSLLVFAHSVPNNTLPIIWSDKNNWNPLYPRNAREKISQTKQFRNETFYWLSIAYNLDLIKNISQKNELYLRNLNYKILSIIRLKRIKRRDPVICNILNISIHELKNVYLEAEKLNFLEFISKDRGYDITEYGLRIYNEIKKKIRVSDTSERNNNNKIGLDTSKIYIPKNFMGKT